MNKFQRENRYIVIKRTDLKKVPITYRRQLVDPMFALLAHLPNRSFVVVESDWPEFEPVWRMIEARVSGVALPDPATELAQVKGELASRLETTVRTCELLGIDLDEARKAPGKPSDVLFEHAQKLRRALNGSRKLLVESLRIERKLRHERDEGLAREAELKDAAEGYRVWGGGMRLERDALQQRLAEAEKLLGISWFSSTPEHRAAIDAFLASPGCADGEKAQ